MVQFAAVRGHSLAAESVTQLSASGAVEMTCAQQPAHIEASERSGDIRLFEAGVTELNALTAAVPQISFGPCSKIASRDE